MRFCASRRGQDVIGNEGDGANSTEAANDLASDFS